MNCNSITPGLTFDNIEMPKTNRVITVLNQYLYTDLN